MHFTVELPAVGRRTYVDPSNYDDPEAAVQEFASEVDPAMMFLERMIGGGKRCTLSNNIMQDKY